jgi:hypothetical protein
MPEHVLDPVRPVFRAVAAAMVPELRSVGPSFWSELETEVERALAERPQSMQRQFASFLRLLDWWSLARYGRRLTKLDDTRCGALLHALERHPFLLIRRGIWGVRTLVFLGYYTRSDVASFIGYRAHRDGWSARPESQRERPSATPKDVGVVYKRPLA